MQKRKDLIYEPTQDLLDQCIDNLNEINEQYKDVYKELKTLKYEETKQVNAICSDVDENWKKRFTYKNQAESYIQDLYEDRTKRISELEDIRKWLELDFDMQKMDYYHAKNRLEANRSLDANIAKTVDLTF